MPGLIGLLFVIIQLVLLARFILRVLGPIINWNPTGDWVSILYTVSDLSLLPVYALVQQIHLPFTIETEIYTLIAILAYGILSRIIVRIAKLFVY